jgi:hypothetical protein
MNQILCSKNVLITLMKHAAQRGVGRETSMNTTDLIENQVMTNLKHLKIVQNLLLLKNGISGLVQKNEHNLQLLLPLLVYVAIYELRLHKKNYRMLLINFEVIQYLQLFHKKQLHHI